MNLAPLLFDLFCKRRDLPALRNPVVFRILEEQAEVPVREAFRLPDDGTLADLADQLVPLLAPVGFAEALARGRAGVAVLDQGEVEAFLRPTPEGKPERAARWWEFLPRTDGTYALFPNDALPAVRVEVLLPQRLRRTAYDLRRLRTGLLVDDDGDLQQEDVEVDVGLCVQVAASEPDLPYEGSCAGDDCGAGCSAQVTILTGDGTHLLTGCECPD